MDQTSPSQQSTEPQKVGLYEILIVGIVQIFFFGTLNYFNILSISNVFPNQLGWLPRQSVQKPIENTSTNNSTNYTPISTPAPTLTDAFQYDARKAEELLTQYIKDNLKQEHLPAKIKVQQKLISSGELKGTDYEFGANWQINDNAFFQSNFHYELNTNNPRDIGFSIQLKNISDTIVDSALAQGLTSIYLKDLPNSFNFDCGLSNDSALSFCENFYSLPIGKKGFGVVIGKNQPTNIVLVFSCFIPKESVYYAKRTSCLLFREK